MPHNLEVHDRSFPFLQGLAPDLRRALLTSLRSLWTHTSTALEGNTFTLGDTDFFLREGLTIGGKSLREHQEIFGHAQAVECVYDLVQRGGALTQEDLFRLHSLVQTQTVVDIHAPVGAWKVEPNGTYAVGPDGKSFFLEYPHPTHIPHLMERWLGFFAELASKKCDRDTAPAIFTATHTSFVRIHPFADGNGRMARLLSNIPLLASGLPPILIDNAARREYISLLACYEQETGTLTANGPLLPENETLTRFTTFCTQQWRSTWEEIDKAWTVQRGRDEVR